MTGLQFQRHICETLSEHGFWAYETINKQSGQPVDVIAAKNNVPYIVECKVTHKKRFPFDNVADNQIMACKKFTKCGNSESWFAVWFSSHPDEILFVRAEKIIGFVDSGVASVTYEELREVCEPFLEQR